MKQTPTFLMTLALVMCGLHATADDAQQKRATDGRSAWDQMAAQDATLRANFAKIKPGMTEADVRDLMKPADPDLLRENLWGFRLSIASNTMTERDVTLMVAFKDGKVFKTELTYTCVYINVGN